MEQGKLSHLDTHGNARMVDVGEKPVTARRAVAEGFVAMAVATMQAIVAGTVPKGEVLSTARIAGIMAAKRCSELIPLCHGLAVEAVAVDFDWDEPSTGRAGTVRLRIQAEARINAKTGVEMEALTAVSVAALTLYDMCKAIDTALVIEGIRLLAKTGGRSNRVNY